VGGGSRNTLGCSSNYFRVFIDLNLYFLPALGHIFIYMHVPEAPLPKCFVKL
jgi:hypothetical protein